MKLKFLYVCIGVLTISTILLAVYIVNSNFFIKNICIVCNRSLSSDSMQLWGTTDAIPDEEIARKVADVIIERVVLEEGNTWYKDNVEITFDEKKNEWKLYYWNQEYTADGSIEICLRRDNGTVTYFAA